MSATYEQSTLNLKVTTPLGGDKLLLRAFGGEERVSGLFLFTLEMVSTDKALDFSAVVGKGVTVTHVLNDGTKRYHHGVVARFMQEDNNARFTTYYAELRPWLWLLTKSADCRIFQNKTAPDIIKQVFTDLGFNDYRDALSATYKQREYTVLSVTAK